MNGCKAGCHRRLLHCSEGGASASGFEVGDGMSCHNDLVSLLLH